MTTPDRKKLGLGLEDNIHHEGGAMSELEKTETEIRSHLENGGAKWIEINRFFDDAEQSCVDGRDQEHVIGIPGGDMGALILQVVSAEKVLMEERGRDQFSEDEIIELFNQYLDEFGVFYMHTDEHAVEHLGEALGRDHAEVFENIDLSSEDAVEELLRSPENQAQRDVLLGVLSDPDFVGCGHLKLMLQNFEDYGVRTEITQALIKAFYQKLWDEPEAVDWVVLPGSHAEKLVLVVHTEGDISDDTLVPAVEPLNPNNSGGGQLDEFFIYHPEVVEYLMRNTAHRMATNPDILPDLDESLFDKFFQGALELGETHLTETVGRLAGDKEIWNTTIVLEDDQTVIKDIELAS